MSPFLNFIAAKDDGGGGDNFTGATRRAKLQSNRHHQQTNTQLFTGQMPFLSPNQQCQSSDGSTQSESETNTVDTRISITSPTLQLAYQNKSLWCKQASKHLYLPLSANTQ